MSTLTASSAWKALELHYKEIAPVHMRDQFASDPHRFSRFSLRWNDFLVDYSKNRINDKTMSLLFDLAREVRLKEWTEKMFTGEEVNSTEQRPVLHIALRNRSNTPILVDGVDVMPSVNKVLQHMREFCETIRNGRWTGYTGQPITDIVNVAGDHGFSVVATRRHIARAIDNERTYKLPQDLYSSTPPAEVLRDIGHFKSGVSELDLRTCFNSAVFVRN